MSGLDQSANGDERKAGERLVIALVTLPVCPSYCQRAGGLCVADRSPQALYMRATEQSEALGES